MRYSSLALINIKRREKYWPLYHFFKNTSGSIMLETAFVLPMIFFLFGAIFMLSMEHMKYRSMDLAAADIARRYLYVNKVQALRIRDVAALKTSLCNNFSYIMLKCSDIHLYIDAYDNNKFEDILKNGGLKTIFNGNTLKDSWLNKDNNASFSTTYFEDNEDALFIVRTGYPGIGYVGISATQGQ